MAQSSLCPSSVPLARVSTYNMSEPAKEHRGRLGREQYWTPKQKKTGRNLCNIVWRQQSILLIIRKPPSHLFNFCVSVLDPHQRFFSPSNLSHRSLQGKHKQPYSKINTAILCVFTFHSATSICDSVAQTVVFHFTP